MKRAFRSLNDVYLPKRGLPAASLSSEDYDPYDEFPNHLFSLTSVH